MSDKQKQNRQKRAKNTAPAEKQLEAVFNYPCILIWSDGHQSETMFSRAFNNEDSYKRYLGYKRSGKPYPVKIEAVAPAEPTEASTIFPEGTAQGEFELVENMCKNFTAALKQFVVDAERS